MANTVSTKLLDMAAKYIVREMQIEEELLKKMSEAEKIGYLAAKASFSNHD